MKSYLVKNILFSELTKLHKYCCLGVVWVRP